MTEKELVDRAHQAIKDARKQLRAALKLARLCIECEQPAATDPDTGKENTRCRKHLNQMKGRAEKARRISTEAIT